MLTRALVWFTLLSVFLIGCGGGGGGTETPKPEIFVINACTDGGSLQMRMDDNAFLSNLVYTSRSTDFFGIDYRGPEVDGWDVSIHDNGTGAELTRIAKVFNNDSDNIVLLHGLRNFGTEFDKRLRTTTFTVNRKVLNGNRARLIIVHAMERSPGLATPAIRFKNPGDNPLVATNDIAPGAVAVLETDSGTATWDVQRAGTQGVFASGSLTLDPGKVYLVLISGVENDPTPANQIQFTAISLPTVP